MLTKLTLTIEKDVIERAKRYAQGKQKSVSRIVEEYLNNVSYSDNGPLPIHKLESPITDSMVGMFSDSGGDYREMLEEARAERHL